MATTNFNNRLITPELTEALSSYPLYSQDAKKKDALCIAVFYLGNIRWYIMEGQQEGNDFTLYGIVTGLQETEYGYQSATEMAGITYDASEYGLGTLRIEQDKDFKPCTLAEIEDAELQAFLSRLVLNVPDHMIEEDIEQFLTEHDYSLNNISWMAAPIDFVPVQFHEYGICHSDGEELHFERQGKLKDFSIYDSVQEVKHREQEELAAKLRLRGEKVDDGYEWHFEGECPIVAAYDYDEPCDVVILSVRVDKDGYFTIIGDEKNDRGNEHEIEVDDVFAGHLDYIISEIGK